MTVMLIRECSGMDIAFLAVQNGRSEGRILHGYAGKVLTNLWLSHPETFNTCIQSGVFEPGQYKISVTGQLPPGQIPPRTITLQ